MFFEKDIFSQLILYTKIQELQGLFSIFFIFLQKERAAKRRLGDFAP